MDTLVKSIGTNHSSRIPCMISEYLSHSFLPRKAKTSSICTEAQPAAFELFSVSQPPFIIQPQSAPDLDRHLLYSTSPKKNSQANEARNDRLLSYPHNLPMGSTADSCLMARILGWNAFVGCMWAAYICTYLSCDNVPAVKSLSERTFPP